MQVTMTIGKWIALIAGLVALIFLFVPGVTAKAILGLFIALSAAIIFG